MVGFSNVRRTVQNNRSELTGGAVGVGVPVLLRETADVRNGQTTTLLGTPDSLLGRATTPSAAWGLGVGGLTGLLWWMDAGGRALQDFYLAHTATGIPTGIASALLPKSGGSADTQRFIRELSGTRETSTRAASGSEHDGVGDFAPSGGGMEPAQ